MILFLIGLISGVLSGMGIGGGTILIPALVLFRNPGQQTAQGINLVYFLPTAIIALIVHIRNKNVDFCIALPIAISGFTGVFLGSRLALSLPALQLRRWFGVFLLAVGVFELLRNDGKRKGKKH